MKDPLIAIAAGIAILSAGASSIGEGYLCGKAIEGMSRNPEMYGKLRSSMIIGCALVETCGIYSLLISILLLFVF
ncbi:MAG: ATP synthase F0 subunit C [Bacilli bacterium]|nr:ATP synthase F0 subunit C [Bacilli bacterium]MBR0301933.1 ATP synthase F0 subunit C [Bacilli bacterium]MDY6276361.1 ATP synthase F0 subunit C [Bacilli bacterium]MDY6362731.1 ATP synthase F0 subunit C [Bacilli bacterium]